MQSKEPFVGLYLPIWQDMHGPSSGPEYPTMQEQSVIAPTPRAAEENELFGQHWQVVSTAPPSTLDVFTLQPKQGPSPVTDLNFPLAHWTQTPVSFRVYPLSQILQDDPATGVNVPVIHCVHAEEPGSE